MRIDSTFDRVVDGVFLAFMLVAGIALGVMAVAVLLLLAAGKAP